MLIYFTGYRACGKTTVARQVGSVLQMPVIDLDAEIVQAAGQSVVEIFASGGEARFRDLESNQLERVTQLDSRIIALGGGAILRPENRERIRRSGCCVWLDADPETVIKRITQDAQTASQRPGLTDGPMHQEVRQLMADRRPLYDEVSDLRIDTTHQPIDAIVKTVINWLK